ILPPLPNFVVRPTSLWQPQKKGTGLPRALFSFCGVVFAVDPEFKRDSFRQLPQACVPVGDGTQR
ncbi:MAG: hypothetical protein KDJ27_03265, partial [Gammaproteobacteria bacterium]|nr:hypothetical protein [Gammaproteobacteria bacterium]